MKKIIALGTTILILLVVLAGCSQSKSGNTDDNGNMKIGTSFDVVEEEVIINRGTEYELGGVLTLPDNAAEPLKAIVLVQGSGRTDRDETVGSNKPFKDIAEYLSAQGFAVLRYDKRTFVYGDEMALEPYTVEEESIQDAIAAANLIKADSRIDPNKVFLLGHSEGGMLAPRIDAEGGDFAGIITLAGSPRELWELMFDQNMLGIEQAESQGNQDIQGTSIEDVKDYITAEALRAQTFADMSDDDAKATTLFGLPGYYQKDLITHPTKGYLEKLNKPILVLQGEKDIQIYADKDFAAYKEILAGKANAQFILYQSLDHMFMPARTDQIIDLVDSYLSTPGHVDQKVLADIADWLAAN